MGLLSGRTVGYGLILLVAFWSFLVSAQRTEAQTPFTMSVYPDQIVLGTKSGFTDRFIITVLAGQTFKGTVYISVTDVPENVRAVLRDQVLYLMSLTTSMTYLEVTSSPDARFGNYTLTVIAESQGVSIFYAVTTRVNLVIQEVGQPRSSEGNQTVITGSSPEPHYTFSITIAFAAGVALGSIVTYVSVHRRKVKRKAASL